MATTVTFRVQQYIRSNVYSGNAFNYNTASGTAQNWWALIEYPNGTFQAQQGTTVTFTASQEGIYRVYSYGDLNPGTVTTRPTNIPLPTGTTFATTNRMVIMDFTTSGWPSSNVTIDIPFRYDAYYGASAQNVPNPTPFAYTDYVNDPGEFMVPSAVSAGGRGVFNVRTGNVVAGPDLNFTDQTAGTSGLDGQYTRTSNFYDMRRRLLNSNMNLYYNPDQVIASGNATDFYNFYCAPLTFFYEPRAGVNTPGVYPIADMGGIPVTIYSTPTDYFHPGGVGYDQTGYVYFMPERATSMAPEDSLYCVNIQDMTSVNWLQIVNPLNKSQIYESWQNVIPLRTMNTTGDVPWPHTLWSDTTRYLYVMEIINPNVTPNLARITRLDTTDWSSITFDVNLPSSFNGQTQPMGMYVDNGILGFTIGTRNLNTSNGIANGPSVVWGTIPATNLTNGATYTASTGTVIPTNGLNLTTQATAGNWPSAYPIFVQGGNSINKFADKYSASPGDIITYTLQITNSTTIPYTNISYFDSLPAGLTFVPGSVVLNGTPLPSANVTTTTVVSGVTLTLGNTDKLTFQALVSTTLPVPNTITNTGHVTYTANGTTTTTTVTATTLIPNQAVLASSIKGVDQTVAPAGTRITYTITIVNTGNLPANNVVVTDPLNSNLQYIPSSLTGGTGSPYTGITVGTIPAGGTTVVRFSATIAAGTATGTIIPNQAGINYNYTGPNGVVNKTNMTNTVYTTVGTTQGANLSQATKGIDKTIVNVGDIVTFSFVVPNTGALPATNVIFSDTLPSQLQFVPGTVQIGGTSQPSYTPSSIPLGTIPSGSVVLLSFQAQAITASTVPVTNVGQLSYVDTTGSYTVPTSVVTIPLIGPRAAGANFGTSTKTTTVPVVTVGGTIPYTIALTNSGSVPATNVIFTDPLPAGITFNTGSAVINGTANTIANPVTGIFVGTIAAGATTTITFTVTANSIPTPNPFTNRGTIIFNDQFGNGQQAQTTGAQTQVNATPRGNLGTAIKGASPFNAVLNTTITYTFTIPNTGSLAATNVIITDILPAGVSFLPGTVIGGTGTPATGIVVGTIPAGSQAVVSFGVMATTIVDSPLIANYATITYGDTSGGSYSQLVGPANNLLQQPTPGGANLSGATKGNNVTSAQVGQTMTYTLTIPNSSTVAATNVFVYDTLPAGLAFVGIQTVTGATGPITGSLGVAPGLGIGTIPGTTTAVVTFNVLVNSIPNPSTFTNVARINYSDQIGSYTLPVVGPATPITSGSTAKGNLGNTTKGVNNSNPSVGSQVTYTLTIPNTGTATVTNVSVYDALTPGLTVVGTPVVTGGATGGTGGILTVVPGFNIGSIAPGGVAYLTFNVLVNSVPNPNPYVNTAILTYTDPTGTSSIPATGGSLNVGGAGGADLGNARKTVSNNTPQVGDAVTYTITIPNAGTVPANNVQVLDTLTPGINLVGTPVVTGASGPITGSLTTGTGLNIGTVAANSTAVITFVVAIASLPSPNPYVNTATISYTDVRGSHTNKITGGILTVTQPTGTGNGNLGNTTKTVNNANPSVGQQVTYTLTIPNTGTATVTNVTVYDALTAGLTLVGTPVVTGASGPTTGSLTVAPGLNIGSIGVGGTAVVNFNILVNSVPNPNPYVNTATITYSDPTGSKTINATGGSLNVGGAGGADFGNARKTASNNAPQVGNAVTYTITIPNAGTVPANNVQVLDTLTPGINLVGTPVVTGASGPITGSLTTGTGLNIGTVAANSTAVITFVVVIVSLPNPNPYVNTATISYTDARGSHTNKITGGILTVTQPTGTGNGNLGNTTKTVNNGNPSVGQQVTYTLTIPNTGTATATNVTVYDALPAGLALVGTPVVTGASGPTTGSLTVAPGLNIGSIGVGGTAVVTFNILVTSTPNPNPYVNTVTITYSDPTGSKTINATGGSLNVGGAGGADFGNARKTASNNAPQVGDSVTYTITIPNTGTVPANNVQVLDTLTPGINLVGTPVVTGASGPITGSLTTGTGLNIGTVAANSTAVITFVVAIASLPNPNPYVNTATISYTDARGNHTNKITGGILTVGAATGSNLSTATKQGDKTSVGVGEIISYTLTIPNTGVLDALNVTILDTLPAGLSLVAGSVSVVGASGPIVGNPTLAPGLNIGTIVAGVTAVVRFGIQVNSIPNPPSFSNQAQISYTDGNGKPGVVITPPSNIVTINAPNLQMTKTADRVGAIVGDTINYRITVQNRGVVAVNNVTIVDALNPYVQLIANSVKLNGVTLPGDLTKGINIGTVAPGVTAVITYAVRMISVPPTGSLTNQGIANYTYQLVPGGPTYPGTMSSNPLNTIGYNANVTITKAANKTVALAGETIVYTITYKNNGNIASSDIVLQDTLPAGLTVQSITVDGTAVTGNVATGIAIGALAIGQTKIVILTVKVTGVVIPSSFSNTIQSIITYPTSPNNPSIQNIQTNQIGGGSVSIITPHFKMVKSASTAYAAVGDTITYTVVGTNDGNVAIEAMSMNDLLPVQLEFIPGSVTINGNPSPTADILAGITFQSIPVGGTVTVTFGGKAVAAGQISNQITAQYTYRAGTGMPLGSINTSNVVTINVSNINVTVTKVANTQFAVLGDTITYTVTVFNGGDTDVANVVVHDSLARYLQLVPGSFRVNGVVINNVDPEKGVNIGIIRIGQKAIITYQAKIISNPCNSKITNSAHVTYAYILPNGGIGMRMEQPTEGPSVIDMGISNFKQMSIESYLQIPTVKPDIETINGATGTIDIKQYHVIDTPIGQSVEGQRLTGHKLVIRGVLNFIIEYTALDEEQSVHSAHYSIPFSTFIILPQDYVPGSKIEVEGIVEDIYYNAIDIRNFFTNTTVLINVKILFC